MQQVNLVLDHYNFYCPVTGIKVFDEDGGFQSSPAMVFCFVDEGEDFEYAQDWVAKRYNQFLEESEDDAQEAYHKMIQSLDPEKTQNLVCFSIEDAFPLASFGPSKFCFDMNYKA